MNEIEKERRDWKEVILSFLRNKCDVEEEKYLKNKIKDIGKVYAQEKYFDDDFVESIFDTKKTKKDKAESPVSFQRRRALSILKLSVDKVPSQLNLFLEKKEYLRIRKHFFQKYNPESWLAENCMKAGSVTFATHVIKLTHSKIDTPSFLDAIGESSGESLTTSSLKRKIVDGAVAGNQYSPIFQFLELELNGVKLAEKIAQDDDFFAVFLQKDNEGSGEILSKWSQGFRKALNGGVLSTHFLAKQVYFPLEKSPKKNSEYNLLCNVVSSSLAHAIHEEVLSSYNKVVVKAIEKDVFLDNVLVNYFGRTSLNVTASNHSNASQLNGKRGGKLKLFSCAPPSWQSKSKPPIHRKSFFYELRSGAIKTEIDFLSEYLLRFNSLDLSIRSPKRKKHMERWVSSIVDELLFYISNMQSLASGWSEIESIKLKEEHQYLLDPYRMGRGFQEKRQSCDWQAIICVDFSHWLNRQLKYKNKKFTPQKEHSSMWKKLLENPLREHMEWIEQDMKNMMKETV